MLATSTQAMASGTTVALPTLGEGATAAGLISQIRGSGEHAQRTQTAKVTIMRDESVGIDSLGYIRVQLDKPPCIEDRALWGAVNTAHAMIVVVANCTLPAA
jgi:hypothetical protein